MSLKIVKSHDPIEVKNITVLIYGQPGVGKTSLAFTADSPLLLDFDRGAYRSQFRKDSVQVDAWSDVASLSESDLEPYDTIIVDTVGRLLDALTAHLIRGNPKLARGSGALSLQGYGELKASYATWLKTLLSFGKDVILIAHDREDKNGDDLIVRPDIQGGSYGEVFKRSDGVAYMYRAAKQTVLDFSPSDRFIAKNAANFDPFPVPHFAKDAAFMARVISGIKDALNSMSAEAQEIASIVADWRAKAEEAADADAINGMVKDAAALEGPAAIQVKHMIHERAVALGLEYKGPKGKGRYVAKEAA